MCNEWPSASQVYLYIPNGTNKQRIKYLPSSVLGASGARQKSERILYICFVHVQVCCFIAHEPAKIHIFQNW